jgi:hypothetical protein
MVEAFGCDADSAVAMRRYRPALWKRALYTVLDYGTAVAVAVGFAWALVKWWAA